MEISAHELCKSKDCIRCEINEADDRDGLCERCRWFIKNGHPDFMKPSPLAKSGYASPNRLAEDPHLGPIYKVLNENELKNPSPGRFDKDRIRRRNSYRKKGS